MKTLILIFAMMLFSINLYSAPPEGCLKDFYDPEETFTNPYFVKVDSCLDSPTFGEFYGKEFYYLDFQYNIIPRDYLAPKDTIIEYTWQDILPQYDDAREVFQQFEIEFGNFYFRENVPESADTTEFYSRELILRFENYVNIENVESALGNIACLKSGRFVGWFGYLTSVNDSETQTNLLVFPNPVTDLILIQGFEDLKAQSYTIYNTFGQKLCEADLQEQIDVSFLTHGVYFISFGNKSFKFVKI